MTRFLTGVFSLALAAAATAQRADLRVTVTGPDRVDPGTTISWSVTVENAGPDPAPDAYVEATAHPGTRCMGQVVPLASGEARTFPCESVVPADTYVVVLVGQVYSQHTADLEGSSNYKYKFVNVTTPPDLLIAVSPPFLADRGLPFAFEIRYRDTARTPVTGVVLNVTMNGGALFAAVPKGCTFAGSVATCAIGTMEPHPHETINPIRTLRFEAIAPDANKATIGYVATISSDGTDTNPSNNRDTGTTRTFNTIFVANIDDSGSGSLRAAIEQANACADDDHCKIGFHVPLRAAQWATIRPETPLPALTKRDVLIDGTVQSRVMNTNPLGPEIEISGERLSEGDGITLAARCGAGVRGLAINGFPDNGVLIADPHCASSEPRGGTLIFENYIGTDPTGTRALPNLRGIFVVPEGADFNAPVHIFGNVISGNRYSGIWVAGGTQTRISNNVIGLNRTLTAGLGNGSSGVYITRGGSGTDLVDNHLGFNGHAGLSLEPGAAHVAANGNSFQANGSLAIDHGLDGVSPSVPDPFIHRNNRLHAPVITSARFDAAANKTVIEGTVNVRLEDGCCRSVYVTLYANDAPDESGFGEGQYYLGITLPDQDGRFTFDYAGRPPGRWIASTANSYHSTGFVRTPEAERFSTYGIATSEFGRTVEVSP